MDINELNKQELSIDEWITIFKEKAELEESEEKREELNDTLEFLSHVKVKIESMEGASTVSEEVLFCMKYVCDCFEATFNTWTCSIIQYNTHIVLCNDIVFIEISSGMGLDCSVSFNYQANPILVSETTLLLHNIFGVGLNILADVFMMNPLNQEYIWGEENIKKYKLESQPRRLNQIVVFGEEGNC